MNLASLFIFPFFLVFCRLGMAVMVFPALSDIAIPPRTRLSLALGASLVMVAALQPQLPGMPGQTSTFISLIAAELFIGLGLAIAARFMLAALSVAGELIAFMAGFQSATLFDPQSGASTGAPTVFLTLMAGVLMLATGLHHQLFQAVLASYQALPPGQPPPVESFTQALIHVTALFTRLGAQLAGPVIVVGLLVNLMFGIFNRLIPQLQIFFLSQPVAITLSLIVLLAALPLMLSLFLQHLTDNLTLYQQEETLAP